MTARTALAALLLCSVIAGCGIGGSATIGAPVTVYVSLPLSGPRGADGRDAADGARLALEQAGGRAGAIRVQARYLDDARGRPWNAVAVGANARQAIEDSSAAAYIGELDSEPTRASVPITNDAGLLQVSPGAGAVDLTAPANGYSDTPDRYQPSGSPNFARVVPSDEVVVDAAISWAAELGIRRITAGFNPEIPFQKLTSTELTDAAAREGVQVVGPTGRPTALYDLLDQVLRVSRGGAPILPRGGGPTDTYALGAELAPSRLPGKAFPGQFERRFHRAPGPSAAYGFEAMALVLQAIRGAGTDASSFRDRVRNDVFGAVRDGTVLGSYSITSDGDTTECMIQRYRVQGATRIPLGAPCPPR